MPLRSHSLLAAVLLLTISGCQRSLEPSEPTAPKVAAATPASSYAPQRVTEEQPGLHNVIEVADGLLSGSEPEGAEGFSSLAKLGVKTVISVDGARPAVDVAHAHGLRYIHVPIGYDGVPKPAVAALARAAREAEGPIYVHCHHGKHRGPAAAAVACIAARSVSGKDALKILELAGTGKEYPGLWRDVAACTAPSLEETAPDLVEIAEVDSLTAAMAGVDRHWDNMKLCRDAGWTTPPDHPDLTPAQAALLLREAFHEAKRTIPADRFDGQFREWLADAESLASQIEDDLKAPKSAEATRSFDLLDQTCKRCHAKYRN
jgi:protein tyrosine phosphatase (PTP) superfamily phosphohydrolase (DUF442 family)